MVEPGAILKAFLVAVALSLAPVSARAAELLLYEIPLEMNGNQTPDRAMLVVVGDNVKIEEAKPLEFYQLEQGQRADLLIFLDVEDDALNVTDTPSIRKQGLAVSDRLAFVMPFETNAKGSLNIITSNGFGNTFNTTETLTVVYRNAQFLVAGFDMDLYARGEDAHCSINFLNGKAVRKRFDDTRNQPMKGNFKQTLQLADWSEDVRPKACDSLGD